ncbi:hypothetical protein JCM10449v2_000474 [Rhodotorula kratochvilovae]
MQSTRTHLVSVPGVQLAHVDGATPTVLFDAGTLDLFLCRPQAQSRPASPATGKRRTPPPPPGTHAPPSYNQATLAPPPPAGPSSSTSSSSSPGNASAEWLSLTLTLLGDSEPAFEMPVSLAHPAESVVASPPASYDLPNTAGQDPLTLDTATSAKGAGAAGRIRLTLPRELDSSTREQFEAALYGLYRGPGGDRSGAVTPVQTEPNALYLVDEASGRVLGQLDHAAAGLALQEDPALAAGEAADAPGSTASNAAKINDVGAHEAVVIAPTTGADGALVPGMGQTLSVRPASAYFSPAENPQDSRIISVANTVSHGIIVGSNLLSKQFEAGAGKYVASRPATEKPLVFKQGTKGAFEKTSKWTQTATVYSGKAAGAVGQLASTLGNKIGKATGIQQQPGGPPPSGWKGALSATLTAVNTVADHLEAGGKTLVDSGSKSASQVIHHKYGAEARGVADDVGSSVKHVALVYIDARGVTRKALLKSVGKGALKAKMADGSEVYLSNSTGELKQLEAAAAAHGTYPVAIEAAPSPVSGSGPGSAGGSGTGTPLRLGTGGGYAAEKR